MLEGYDYSGEWCGFTIPIVWIGNDGTVLERIFVDE